MDEAAISQVPSNVQILNFLQFFPLFQPAFKLENIYIIRH